MDSDTRRKRIVVYSMLAVGLFAAITFAASSN
jgi:hypothetical protein